MADFRVSTTFFQHVKTRKLKRALGAEGILALQMIWAHAAANKHAQGRVYGVDDIEIAADWGGEEGALVAVLSRDDIRFLDPVEGGYAIHQWAEHNGFAATGKQRSEVAQKNANTRWQKYKKQEGSGGENAGGKASVCGLHDADDANGNADLCNAQMQNDANGNAPSPSPSPSLKENCKPSSLRSEGSTKLPLPQEQSVSHQPMPQREAILTFPLAKKGTGFEVRQEDIAQWQESFPGVDVVLELRRCRQWNIDNPRRRKTATGIRQHISTWLGKEQNQARSSPPPRGGDAPWRQMTARQRYMEDLGNFLEAINGTDTGDHSTGNAGLADPLPRGGVHGEDTLSSGQGLVGVTAGGAGH